MAHGERVVRDRLHANAACDFRLQPFIKEYTHRDVGHRAVPRTLEPLALGEPVVLRFDGREVLGLPADEAAERKPSHHGLAAAVPALRPFRWSASCGTLIHADASFRETALAGVRLPY